ncbi:nose resistant to fluoxetine protein 6-like [Mytilus californianus]|uniref:nose resistant to fluoxetine protein 6-like n=1 Tax=Mytilus californianus TaxID=6549 RepID=UPI002246A044|nr:nose resistant to fluoxetine protein 6-like [Mytilus californianus]
MVRFINKSPNSFEIFTKAAAKLSTSGNIFNYVNAGHHMTTYKRDDVGVKNFFAENVTDVPLNITTESIETTVSPTPTISELCLNHSQLVSQALQRQDYWAMRMVDAAGKPSSNILSGGLMWLGSYDECLEIKVVADHNNITYRFDGQYCKVYIVPQGELSKILPKIKPFVIFACSSVYLLNRHVRMNVYTFQAQSVIQLGVCVPDSCSATDTWLLVNNVLPAISDALLAWPGECIAPDQPFDTRAIIVLVVLSVFMAVMAIGTAYDVLLIQWPRWKETKTISENSEEIAVEVDEKAPLLDNQKKKIPENQPGLIGDLLLAFSIYTNGAKLFNTKQNKDILTCINGIRFISMTWVILGHTYSMPLQMSDNMVSFFPKMIKRWTFGAIANATVSVDTFFTLSGCLLTYLVMKELKKKNGRLNWGMFYFHRFWRLTPPYMLVLMVYVSLFHYTGSGPNWPNDGPEKNHCEKAWYYNLLYINNFFDDKENQCMLWSWYLACDMQFFVLSPLIILPLYFFPIVGFGIMMVFLLGTWIATGVISSHYEIYPKVFTGDGTHFNKIYFRSYCRMGPYLVGMFTGYLLYRTRCNIRISKYWNLLGWGIATGVSLAVLYGLYDDMNGERLSTEMSALYNTVHRTVWGACVAWVIFACATGYGGFVNVILSWKGFIPLSRLTYMAYLVHIIIMMHYIMSYQRMFHLTDSEYPPSPHRKKQDITTHYQIYQFLGNLGLSYMAAFVTTLAFESPMMGLERVIFKKEERKR